jgi:hypothetical protein
MFTHLLVLNPIRHALTKIRIDDGATSEVLTDLDAFPDGLLVDQRRGRLYWSNMGAPQPILEHRPHHDSDLDFTAQNGSIEATNLDGTDRSWVLPPGSFVTGKQLTASWTRGRLYWADREGAAIRSVTFEGADLRDEVVTVTSDSQRLILRNQCVGVAIDERGGYLYWTQKGPSHGGDGRIFRTELDLPPGANPAERDVEVLWSGLPEPIDLELDLHHGLLYWTDRGAPPGGNTLNRAAVPAPGHPGGAVEILSRGFGDPIGLDIDHESARVYVGDLSGEIRAVSTAPGNEAVTIARVPGGVTGLAGLHF